MWGKYCHFRAAAAAAANFIDLSMFPLRSRHQSRHPSSAMPNLLQAMEARVGPAATGVPTSLRAMVLPDIQVQDIAAATSQRAMVPQVTPAQDIAVATNQRATVPQVTPAQVIAAATSQQAMVPRVMAPQAMAAALVKVVFSAKPWALVDLEAVSVQVSLDLPSKVDWDLWALALLVAFLERRNKAEHSE